MNPARKKSDLQSEALNSMKNEPKRKGLITGLPETFVFSRARFLISITGIFFLTVWVFSLGVLIGRGTMAQNKAYQALENRLDGMSFSQNLPVVTKEDGAEFSKKAYPELTFYKTLSETGDGTRKRAVISKKASKKTSKKTGHTVRKMVSKEKPTPENRIKNSSAQGSEERSGNASVSEKVLYEEDDLTAAKSVTSKKPPVKTIPKNESEAMPPKRMSGQNFTVQVAIVRDGKRAERLVNSLRSKGHQAYYYHVQHKDDRYFRVRVGRYSTREEAKKALLNLQKTGRKDMFISRLLD